MKQDRLSEAAAIRERIHALARAPQGARLCEIAKAIPEREYGTISRLLRQMSTRGQLRIAGQWPNQRFHAVGESAGASDQVRQRLSRLAKQRQGDLQAAAGAKPRKPREDTPPKPLSEPGIVRNFSAYKAAIPNQGGQGVVAARPRMASVMGSLG